VNDDFEIAFFYEAVRPDLPHQLISFGQTPAVFHKREQRVEGFERERNGATVAQEGTLCGIESERAELIAMSLATAHNRYNLSLTLL
jgi:hypothetical protein